MDQIAIGKFIAKKRKEQNLTQEQLAVMIGVSNKTVSKWETGKCMPDYSIIKDLCSKLNITVSEFMDGEESENKITDMLFSFDPKLNDDDYFLFNDFLLLKSPFGKKSLFLYKILSSIFYSLLMGYYLMIKDFKAEFFIFIIPIAVAGLIIHIAILPKTLSRIYKKWIKYQKKNGHSYYSSEDVIEFYNNCIIDITPERKTERKYSDIEQISVVTEKAIYIHLNMSLAYILPFRVFESEEIYNEFINFIKTKCNKITIY